MRRCMLSSHQYHPAVGLNPIREPNNEWGGSSFYDHWSIREEVPWSVARCHPNGGHRVRIIYAMLAILALGVLVLTINVYQLQGLHKDAPHPIVPTVEAQGEDIPVEFRGQTAASASRTALHQQPQMPIVWIHGRNLQSGYLNHIFGVFGLLGYTFGHAHSAWDILWAHDYPFIEMQSMMKDLKPNQKVNHFPGSGFITNKVSLATSNITYIPTAFKMPHDQQALLQFAETYPNKVFVQKNNKHRGIKVETLSSLNLTQEGSFVQEFIQNPLLIDQRKFDIGIYTIITSIDPLRVYIYNGDALLRFCALDYHPFDAGQLDKYVVGDDYTPTWEMPSLKHYYETLGYTMKESLNAFLKSKGKDPNMIWVQIEDAIRQVILEKEPKLIAITSKYKTSRNFFEMMRFDFVLDENLNVHIMEANMSPNLSSTHFPQNKLLYEQVIYNVLSLVGLAHWLHRSKESNNGLEDAGHDHRDMRASKKDLMVNADQCNSETCYQNCQSQTCHLCSPCLDRDWIEILRGAYEEHVSRHNCRRIFPPPLSKENNGEPLTPVMNKLNEKNKLMMLWFRGKCIQDHSWCQ